MEFPNLERLLSVEPIYQACDSKRYTRFYDAVKEVSKHHFENCAPFRNLCLKRHFGPDSFTGLDDLPYLPTSIFKDALLVSVPQEKVFREINSSATTSGRPSRMALDKQTSRRQSKCFNKVVMERIGNERRKFLVLDEPSSVERSSLVNARSSTIKSLLFSASTVQTCLKSKNSRLQLDFDHLEQFLTEAERNCEPVVIFGFTFILYEFVIRDLLGRGRKFNLPGSMVIHIGGWKKLEERKVTPEKLIADCHQAFGVHERDVVDFYGFTEQSGLIYPTCEAGVRHLPEWAWLLVRDSLTLEVLPQGQTGLLHFISPIETSYPGHSVLTEDMGFVVGEDNCTCGRKGRTFKVVGRASNAEIRGCGDIMAEKFA